MDDSTTHGYDIELQQLLANALADGSAPDELRHVLHDAFDAPRGSGLIAELVLDSAAQPLAIRGRGPRQMSFEAGDVAVDLVVRDDRIGGQIAPPGPGLATLVTQSGEITTEVNDLGEFTFTTLPDGPFFVQTAAGVRTDWMIL